MKKITIVGGGIAGLCTAVALRRVGIVAEVLETAPVPRALGAGLVLAANAMRGLQKIGVDADIIARGQFLDAFAVRAQGGAIISRNDSLAISKKYGADNFVVHRADLHAVLLSQLPEEAVLGNRKVLGFERRGEQVLLKMSDNTEHLTDYVIAADGIHSPIRKQLLPSSRERYAGYTCWRAVIDGTDFGLREASETWGRAGRVGLVPLSNNRIYWFACINSKQNNEVYKNFTINDLALHFKDYHQPIPDVFGATPEGALIWGDICDIAPINQFAFGNVLLIGDAGHATTPNMGQGACQAIEDAVVLADLMARGGDYAAAFVAFEKRRKARVHKIVNDSWRVGKVAQWTNPLAIGVRNTLFRWVAPMMLDKQLRFIYTVDF